MPNTSFIYLLYLGKLHLLYFGIYLRYILYLQSQIVTHCKSPFKYKIFHNYGMTSFPALNTTISWIESRKSPTYSSMNLPNLATKTLRKRRLLLLRLSLTSSTFLAVESINK